MNLTTSFKVGFYLSLRQLKRASKGTTILIVFIMTLTFLNLVVVNGILVGLLTGSEQQFKERYSGDILISPQDRLESIEYSQKLIEIAKAEPGTVGVAARTVATGRIRAGLSQNPNGKESPNENGGSLVGVDLEQEQLVTGLSEMILEGEMLRPSDEDGIMIGANLIKEYSNFADANFPGFTILRDIKIGDKVRVSVTKNTVSGPIQNSKEMIVKAIIKSKVDQVSQRSFMLESTVRKLVGNTDLNVQEIAIKTSPESVESLLNSLKVNSDPSKVRVQTSKEAIPSFLLQIKDTFGILGNVIGSIGLVVVSITIFIVIFINAVTRRKYIGILKGIGVESAAIKIAYVIQALFYGVLGCGIGTLIIFGFLVGFFQKHPLDFPFSDGILEVSIEGTLIRAGVLLLITLIAGYLPARIIVKQNTLDSILGR